MAVISWDNYVDDATITNNSALESPVNSTEALSVQKLKTRQIGDVFRQTFAALTSPNDQLVVDFDLGSAKATNLFCVLNHTMAGYSYTLTFGTSAGASDVGTETGTFWSGTSYHANNEMLLFSSPYTARYVRLAVAIPAATSVDIGRIWMDSAWTYQNALEFSVGVVDRSKSTKSRGGSTWADSRQKLRVLNIRAYGKNDADFFGSSSDADMKSFLTMDLAAGIGSGEIICLPAHANQHERQVLGVYGAIASSQPISVRDRGAAGLLTEKRFTVEEDRV